MKTAYKLRNAGKVSVDGGGILAGNERIPLKESIELVKDIFDKTPSSIAELAGYVDLARKYLSDHRPYRGNLKEYIQQRN